MNSRVLLKTMSFIHSGVVLGVFCSSFVTEITKDQKLVFRDFYKTISFYVLLCLLLLEFAKNIIIDILTKKDDEIKRLNLILENATNIESNLILNAVPATPLLNSHHSNEELSLEEIKIYTKKKIIDAVSDRYSELIRRGESSEELIRLEEVLARIFEE